MADDSIKAEYPNSEQSPNAPVSVDRSPAISQSTHPSTSAHEGAAPDLASGTVGDLRRRFGAHLAPGYGDTDPVSKVLSNAGETSVEAYVKRNRSQESNHA